MGCLPKKWQYPSTGPPTYQIIKVTNANHMSMMKISLTIIPMCPQERFAYYKRLFWPVLCLKRIGLPCCTFVTTTVTCSLQIMLLPNYSVTYNFSTCRHYLAENHLSVPSAPRWVRHSYLSKKATIDPMYLWVIKAIFWHHCRGVKRSW